MTEMHERPTGYMVSTNPRRREGSPLDDRWTNPILDMFRDSWDSGDPWGSALMALGNLHDYNPGDFVDREAVREGAIDSHLEWLDDLWHELLENDSDCYPVDENIRLSTEVWERWSEHAYRIINRIADIARLQGRDY